MFRRGFKTQCEAKSLEVRRQLGLADIDPLSAHELARFNSVNVVTAQEVSGVSAEDLVQLVELDPDCWSAFTLRIGERFLVVVNPSQSGRRINSVLMHELSHILLGHELASATTSEDGYLSVSHYNQDQEDEANWLGGALLLPRPALFSVRRKRLSDEEAAEHFNVSHEMLRWRFRMTGVDIQLQNYRRRAF